MCARSRLPYSWPKFVHLKRLDCDGPVSRETRDLVFSVHSHTRAPDHYHYTFGPFSMAINFSVSLMSAKQRSRPAESQSILQLSLVIIENLALWSVLLWLIKHTCCESLYVCVRVWYNQTMMKQHFWIKITLWDNGPFLRVDATLTRATTKKSFPSSGRRSNEE